MGSRLDRLREWVRPEIRGLQPYVPEPSGPTIRLDANESPYDMPMPVKQAIWESFTRQAWNRYPDPDSPALREAIATIENVEAGQIVLGNGSDEIIRDLLICYGGTGTKTIFPTPTFSMYRLLTIALGGTPVGIRLNSDWSLDVPALKQALTTENSRLLFIPSPNNPTGNAFPTAQILELVAATDRLVVVDEAYRMFNSASLVPYIKEYPNLVILSTFSKSMSAAGIRIGYLVGNSEVVNVINRVRLPYNMDSFAQTVALQAVEAYATWQENAKKVVAERERLIGALSSLEGVVVYPSQANFILIQVPDGEAVKAGLAQRNIAVRGFPKTEGLSECLRVTVGLPEENEALLQALPQVLALQKG